MKFLKSLIIDDSPTKRIGIRLQKANHRGSEPNIKSYKNTMAKLKWQNQQNNEVIDENKLQENDCQLDFPVYGPTIEQYNMLTNKIKSLESRNNHLSKIVKDKDNVIKHQIERIAKLLEENKVVFNL